MTGAVIRPLSPISSTDLTLEAPGARPAPRVSIITIFLNADRYLDEAIKSVFAQDFQDLELLLVDDGSSDQSTAIALDYTKRFPNSVRYLDRKHHAKIGTETV